MPSDSHKSSGYITYKCRNCDISVTSPNMIEYIIAMKLNKNKNSESKYREIIEEINEKMKQLPQWEKDRLGIKS